MRATEPEPSVHVNAMIIPEMSFRFFSAVKPCRVEEEKGRKEAPYGGQHAQYPGILLIVLILMLLLCFRASFNCWIAKVANVTQELFCNGVHSREQIHEESATLWISRAWNN